jgi:hypothetical protein
MLVISALSLTFLRLALVAVAPAHSPEVEGVVPGHREVIGTRNSTVAQEVEQ